MHIAYKIDFRSEGNLVPFKFFKTLFPTTTIKAFHAKNNSVELKTYSQSNIGQLGMCTVRLRQEMCQEMAQCC